LQQKKIQLYVFISAEFH